LISKRLNYKIVTLVCLNYVDQPSALDLFCAGSEK